MICSEPSNNIRKDAFAAWLQIMRTCEKIINFDVIEKMVSTSGKRERGEGVCLSYWVYVYVEVKLMSLYKWNDKNVFYPGLGKMYCDVKEVFIFAFAAKTCIKVWDSHENC